MGTHKRQMAKKSGRPLTGEAQPLLALEEGQGPKQLWCPCGWGEGEGRGTHVGTLAPRGRRLAWRGRWASGKMTEQPRPGPCEGAFYSPRTPSLQLSPRPPISAPHSQGPRALVGTHSHQEIPHCLSAPWPSCTPADPPSPCLESCASPMSPSAAQTCLCRAASWRRWGLAGLTTPPSC